MKKTVLIIVMFMGFSQILQAQTEAGAGLALTGGLTGIEGKANFGISDKISISPLATYYFTNYSGLSIFGLGVDGHYEFGDREALNYYPLVGLNYFVVSFSGNEYLGSYGSGVGLTVGGGATYALKENIKLYGELKYMWGGLGLSAGVLFNL